MKKIILICGLAVALVGLSACQGGDKTAPVKKGNSTGLEKTVVDHGMPVSNGPTSSPNSVKGPTSAPPSSDSTVVLDSPEAQAVTTNENIRLTLPRKTQ